MQSLVIFSSIAQVVLTILASPQKYQIQYKSGHNQIGKYCSRKPLSRHHKSIKLLILLPFRSLVTYYYLADNYRPCLMFISDSLFDILSSSLWAIIILLLLIPWELSQITFVLRGGYEVRKKMVLEFKKVKALKYDFIVSHKPCEKIQTAAL